MQLNIEVHGHASAQICIYSRIVDVHLTLCRFYTRIPRSRRPGTACLRGRRWGRPWSRTSTRGSHTLGRRTWCTPACPCTPARTAPARMPTSACSANRSTRCSSLCTQVRHRVAGLLYHTGMHKNVHIHAYVHTCAQLSLSDVLCVAKVKIVSI